MSTINQINANRANAQKSTGPKTQAGKDRVRFNALEHGCRAESAVIPGEDPAKFEAHLQGLRDAWMPQDDMEKNLVEQIAVDQWKLARIDRAEARFYEEGAMTPLELARTIHRVHLTATRLERAVSATIADLERYRKERLARRQALGLDQSDTYRRGVVGDDENGKLYYEVLPKVRGLDGKWRDIPSEVLADPGSDC